MKAGGRKGDFAEILADPSALPILVPLVLQMLPVWEQRVQIMGKKSLRINLIRPCGYGVIQLLEENTTLFGVKV